MITYVCVHINTYIYIYIYNVWNIRCVGASIDTAHCGRMKEQRVNASEGALGLVAIVDMYTPLIASPMPCRIILIGTAP